MDRRAFLAAGAGGALALAGVGVAGCGTGEEPEPEAPETRDPEAGVIVVGAGLAGLAAAYELGRNGIAATVLEARERVGGRTWTIRGDDGVHAEAGGEFVDTHHRRLRGYCRRFGLPLTDIRKGYGDLESVVWWRGRRWLGSEFRTEDVRDELSSLQRRIYAAARKVVPRDPLRGDGRRWDRMTALEPIVAARLSPRARFLAERRIRDDYGVDPARLSFLLQLLSERIEYEQPAAGVEAFRIAGGADALARAFAERLREPPRLGEEVVRVRERQDGVTVETAGGTFAASAAVLALPMPALRRIAIEPEPPAPLAAAIAELGAVPVAKTLLGYPDRFWRARGESGDLASDLPLGSTWDANVGPRDDAPSAMLVTYAAGELGEAAAELEPAERIAQAAADVRRVWPGAPRPRSARTIAWADDPLAGGAWSTYEPGQVGRHWKLMHASPKAGDRIWLAGEQTDWLTGYMEGAIRSGRRVAGEIGSGPDERQPRRSPR